MIQYESKFSGSIHLLCYEYSCSVSTMLVSLKVIQLGAPSLPDNGVRRHTVFQGEMAHNCKHKVFRIAWLCVRTFNCTVGNKNKRCHLSTGMQRNILKYVDMY